MLDERFSDILIFRDNTDKTALCMSIAVAAEIIKQMVSHDPSIFSSGKLMIQGKPLDTTIIPYFMQVRNGMFHYPHAYQDSSVDEIVKYVAEICVSTSKNRLVN